MIQLSKQNTLISKAAEFKHEDKVAFRLLLRHHIEIKQ